MEPRECFNCQAPLPSGGDGRCPVCRAPNPVASAPLKVVDKIDGVESLVPNASVPEHVPVRTEAPVIPLIVQARRASVFGFLIGVTLLSSFAYVVFFVLSDSDHRGLNIYGIVGVVLYLEIRMIVTWLFPPRITLLGDVFQFRNLGIARTPRSNVADVSLSGGTLGIRFHRLDAVESRNRTIRQSMPRLVAKTGNHLLVPGYRFSVDQVNEIRQSLGLPPQYYDEAGLTIADFQGRLLDATPHPRVTYALIGACIAVAAAMLTRHRDSLFLPNGEMLIDWGADYGPLTLRGEWWRIFSHQFIHVGIVHLAVNMWVLWNIGPLVERMVGSAACLAGYLIAGVAGGIASLWWNPNQVSAGASGALFGLMGILLGVLIQNRRAMPRELLMQELKYAVMFIVLNICLTFSISHIDTSAHLGGVAGGVLFGLLIQPVFTGQSAARRAVRLALAIVACLGIETFLFHQLPVYGDARHAIQGAAESEREILPRFQEIIKQLNANELTEEVAAARIRTEVLAPWRRKREEFEALGEVSPTYRKRTVARLKYLQLREQAFEKYADQVEKGDFKGMGEVNRLTEEAFDVLKESDQAGSEDDR